MKPHFHIDFLKENEKNPSTITWAVTTALIITYGRCFTSTDGNRTQLEQSDIPAEYLETHNRVMAFRNRYIAHASGAGEASYNIFGLYPNKKCKQIFIPICGKIELKIKNYNKEKKIILHKKNIAVLIPNLTWCSLKFINKNSIVMVVCNRKYEYNDYIEKYSELLKILKKK